MDRPPRVSTIRKMTPKAAMIFAEMEDVRVKTFRLPRLQQELLCS